MVVVICVIIVFDTCRYSILINMVSSFIRQRKYFVTPKIIIEWHVPVIAQLLKNNVIIIKKKKNLIDINNKTILSAAAV